MLDDRAADGRRDDGHQQRAARRGELLTDDLHVVDAAAAAAVLLGKVHPEEALFAHGLPQLGALRAGQRFFQVVLVSEVLGDLGDRLAQVLPFLCLVQFHDTPHIGIDAPPIESAPGSLELGGVRRHFTAVHRLDHGEDVTARDLMADLDRQALSTPSIARDGVLHLHRLQDDKGLARRDRLALGDWQSDHRTRHRRGERPGRVQSARVDEAWRQPQAE